MKTSQPSDIEQVESMTDREVVAFWNVLQFSACFGNRDLDKEDLVSQVLNKRRIPHRIGKRSILAETH